jgi:hypothetical protein
MIRNEQEYQSALSRVEEEKKRLEEQKNELANLGLNAEEIERGVAPFLSFHLQLVEEHLRTCKAWVNCSLDCVSRAESVSVSLLAGWILRNHRFHVMSAMNITAFPLNVLHESCKLWGRD